MDDRNNRVACSRAQSGRRMRWCVLMTALMLVVSGELFAKQEDDDDPTQRFPSGCYQQGFDFKYQVLQLHPPKAGNEQSMYFIHNLSMSSPVSLYQMRTGDEPFIMHINNEIAPNQWGVFASDEAIDRFICTVPERGSQYGKIVDCKTILDVCEYTNVKFSSINAGNYWVVESSGMRSAQRSVINQGSLLRR